MTRRAVADATPLIYLARLGLLAELRRFYAPVLVPASVHREVVQRGRALGFPDATALERGFARGLLVRARDAAVLRDVPTTLGRGERAAIALAVRHRCDLLIDDREGHTLARAMGLRPRRTSSLLLEGVARGGWDARRFEHLLAELSAEGYFLTADVFQDLVRQARKLPRHR